jgi:hypothetical protein
MTNRKIEYWVIPPEADAEFAAGMEEVLDTYALPLDPACPVLCMDEQPIQLLKETRTPIAATLKHGERIDYEYERAGTANIFMFTEPLVGWRQVSVRTTKTKVDWATEMATLLEGRYAKCQKVILVCDNLNTHTKGAFYEAFEPGRARELVRRLEFRHTQTRQLAEHRRERTEFIDSAMSGPPVRRHSNAATGNKRLVHRRQRPTARRRLADEDRRRPYQTDQRLS